MPARKYAQSSCFLTPAHPSFEFINSQRIFSEKSSFFSIELFKKKVWYKFLWIVVQVSEVERERLGEHVRVISKKLRAAEEVARGSELALREERRRTAHLVGAFYLG